MGRRLQITQPITLEELKVRHRQEKNPLIRDRLLMLIHVSQGHSSRQVAQMLNVNKGTVSIWVNRFNNLSFEGLQDQPRSGRPPKVNYPRLKRALEASPRNFGYPHEIWFPALVRTYLWDHQHITVNQTHIYWMIKRIGFVLRVPRPISAKSDPDQVEDFKKNENFVSNSVLEPAGRPR